MSTPGVQGTMFAAAGRLLVDLGEGAPEDWASVLQPLAEVLGAKRATLVLLPDNGRSTEIVRTAERDVGPPCREACCTGTLAPRQAPVLALALSADELRIGSLYFERPTHAPEFAEDEVLFASGMARLVALRVAERDRQSLEALAHLPAATAAMENALRVCARVGHDLSNVLVVLMNTGPRLRQGLEEAHRVATDVDNLSRRAADLVRVQLESVERARRAIDGAAAAGAAGEA